MGLPRPHDEILAAGPGPSSAAVASRAVPQARKPLSENAAGYFFLTPWLIGLVLFMAGPTLVSLYFSFTDFNLLEQPKWVAETEWVPVLNTEPIELIL